MTEKLRELLKTVVTGNNDLWNQTIEAAEKLLEGGYEGHQEDVEALEGIETGFELEKVLSRGKWYWQSSGNTDQNNQKGTDWGIFTKNHEIDHDSLEKEAVDYCPGCNVAYCRGRYTTGQCE